MKWYGYENFIIIAKDARPYNFSIVVYYIDDSRSLHIN